MLRRIQLAVACAVALVMAQQSQASPIKVDQSNAVGGGGLGVGFGPLSAALFVGQSFTPSLTSIDAAEFDLRSEGLTSDVLVNLYDGVGYGTLLGTSGSQTIALGAPGDFTTYHFDFASSIALTPGSPYTLQVAYVSGGDPFLDYAEADVYAGGDLIDPTGTPQPGFDMVFAEGVHTPEPSALALLGIAAVIGVGAARRRRHLTRK